MNSVTVDELVMRIEIELDKFRREAAEAERVEGNLRKRFKDGQSELGRALDTNTSGLLNIARRATGFFAVLAGSNALQRFTEGIAKANDQLGFMSKRLGMTGRDVKGLEAALNALGGEGAISTVRSLNQGIQEMVIMGNDALIPFFSALNVGVTDASGNVRDMDEILLDMAGSLERLDPKQAYAIASAMGLDDGMANALIQGRDAMQELLSMHESVYVSTQEEIRASRELNRAQAILSARWNGLKTILGNALIPILTRMTETISGWVDYLNRNEATVKNFFEGMSIALGVVLIPLLTKAALAMVAFLSPILGVSLAVGALGLAFIGLYDDYKTWASGGKSLFNWESFHKLISDTDFSVKGLTEEFWKLTTGYRSWSEAWAALMDWAGAKGIIDEVGISIKNLGKAITEMFKSGEDIKEFWRSTLSPLGLIAEGKWSEALEVAGLKLRTDEGSVGGFVKGIAENTSADGFTRNIQTEGVSDLDRSLYEADQRHGLPLGTMKAIFMQETGGRMEYVDNPAKYHYGLNAEGKRIAPHTGRVSTAFGPFGIVESTAKDPGYGVDPLRDKSLDAQIDFAAQYVAARIKSAGSVEAGLAGYGEGERYAQSVIKKMQRYSIAETEKLPTPNPEDVSRSGLQPVIHVDGGAGKNYSRSATGSVASAAHSNAATANNSVEVNVQNVNVQTSATTLPDATAQGIEGALAANSGLMDQLVGGMR